MAVRPPVKLLFTSALIAVVAPLVSAVAKPNLLFMMADQLRVDTQGADARFGGKPNTPNLDDLAKQGIRFTNAYSSTPTCTPARAAILTGQSPWNHGMLGYGNVAPVYPFEMPVVLRSLGYTTSSIGKDHFGWNKTDDRAPLDPKTDTGDKGSGTPHGYQRMTIYDGLVGQPDDYHQWFDRQQPSNSTKTAEQCWPTLNMNGWMGAPFMCDEYLHPTAWVGQQAVDWLTTASTTLPWFLKISFHRPHSPYDPPARLLNATMDSDLPTPQLASDGWDTVFRGGVGDPSGCGPKDSAAWCGLMPFAEQQLGRRSYYANVAFIDEWVGKIMVALNNQNFLENTFVIWTADHGDGQADHFHWRKGFPYQFSSNVPFIFRWPNSYGPTKTERGTVISDLVVELRDVFPTMLDAAGGMNVVPANHKIDGTSLLCLINDQSGAACTHSTPGENNSNNNKGWRPWLDLEHSTCYNNTNHWSALTDGKMKYIFNACETCTFPALEQLFNLTADPGELVGLHNDSRYTSELAKWRARMVAQFEAEGRGPGWVLNGKLLTRPSETYGPNYPKGPSPPTAECKNTKLKVGDTINLEKNQGISNIKYCQDIVVTPLSQMAMMVAPTLCIQPSEANTEGGLELAMCLNTSENTLASSSLSLSSSSSSSSSVSLSSSSSSLSSSSSSASASASSSATATAAAQTWDLPGVDQQPRTVVHRSSGLCLTATSASTTGLAVCAKVHEKNITGVDTQLWILGMSGRLCVPQGCLSVVSSPLVAPRLTFVGV